MADSYWSLEARVIGVGDCRPIWSAKVITLIGTSRSSIGDPRGFVWRPATCERGRVGVPRPTGATGPQGPPAARQERFLKRQLSLPVSMISQ